MRRVLRERLGRSFLEAALITSLALAASVAWPHPDHGVPAEQPFQGRDVTGNDVYWQALAAASPTAAPAQTASAAVPAPASVATPVPVSTPALTGGGTGGGGQPAARASVPPWEVPGGVPMPPLVPATPNGVLYLPSGPTSPPTPLPTFDPAACLPGVITCPSP